MLDKLVSPSCSLDTPCMFGLHTSSFLASAQIFVDRTSYRTIGVEVLADRSVSCKRAADCLLIRQESVEKNA